MHTTGYPCAPRSTLLPTTPAETYTEAHGLTHCNAKPCKSYGYLDTATNECCLLVHARGVVLVPDTSGLPATIPGPPWRTWSRIRFGGKGACLSFGRSVPVLLFIMGLKRGPPGRKRRTPPADFVRQKVKVGGPKKAPGNVTQANVRVKQVRVGEQTNITRIDKGHAVTSRNLTLDEVVAQVRGRHTLRTD